MLVGKGLVYVAVLVCLIADVSHLGGIDKKNIMKNKIFSEISTDMIPVYGAVILAVLYLFIEFILLII